MSPGAPIKSPTRATRTALVVLLATGIAARAPGAQPGPQLGAAPVAGTVTVRPGFAPDPQTAAGTARGSTDANTFGPTCSGFVGAAPDHALVVQQDLPWLRLYVTSPNDTTLVVRRPDGTWQCDDDSYGRHPAVAGSFPAGRYLVWVGTFHAGRTAPYTFAVTAQRGNHP